MEVAAFNSANLNLDASGASASLFDACAADATRHCEFAPPPAAHASASHFPRHVLACLRERKARLAPACSIAVHEDQMAATRDYTADWPLYDACRGDAERLCRNARGDGSKVLLCLRSRKGQVRCCALFVLSPAPNMLVKDRMLAAAPDNSPEAFASCFITLLICVDDSSGCLHPAMPTVALKAIDMRQRLQLQKPCIRELFRADVEAADDLRLQPSLHMACLSELRTFCAETHFEGGAAQLCLERHRFAQNFSAACRAPLELRMADQARDWRLDVPLREACADDSHTLCQFERDSAGIAPSNGTLAILRCRH